MPAPRPFIELAAAVAAAVFLVAWGVLHRSWYAHDEIVDIPVYASYGSAIEDGEVPYRDFRPEYPPGALPAFALPALLSSDERGFRDAFEWLMAVCGAACVLLAGVTLAGLGASRARAAAALALLVPLALAYVWRRRGRREALRCAGIAAAVVALVFVPFLVVAPGGVAHSIGHQLSRPLQIESLGSALYLAAHHLVGLDVDVRSGHGSQNLHAPGTGAAALLFSLAALAAIVWIWFRRPGTAEELVRWTAAALVAFIALGKVLSPQFLIWLVPVVPLVAGVRGLRASVLFAGALVLTQLWFPSRYWDLARELDVGPSLLVLARDLVLIALLVVLVRDSRRESPRSR